MALLRASFVCAVLALAACGGGAATSRRGHVCTDDRDCEELSCIAAAHTPKDLAPLPLVCGDSNATKAKPGAACELGRDCARGVCLLAGACAEPCADDTDCGAHAACRAVYAREGDAALESLRACVARVSVPSATSVSSTLAAHAIAAGDTDVELEGAATTGETLYVLEHDASWPADGDCRPPLCVSALRTRDTDPVVLYDANADYMAAPPPANPVADGSQISPPVILFPSGARDVLSPAGYVASVEAASAGNLRVTRLSRDHQGGQLDLNVFYVGALDWKPEGTRGPALLSDALDRVDAILGQADIFVGDVRQILVPGTLPMRGNAFPDGDAAQGFSDIKVRFGVYVELPGLFELSAGAGNVAINLFFVRDIEPLGAEPEAESGGIPGPLGMHGTAGSGIAIATNMMAGDAELLGRTLAHEIGHYLGLFHTSEADGRVLESLSDTPECRLAQDVRGDGLGVEDCQDFGADNLMFWAATTGTVLSEQQRAILRAALILQ